MVSDLPRIKMYMKKYLVLNPLVTDPLYLVYMAKISILEKEGIIEKISYERRDYDSVDDLRFYLKNQRKTKLRH